MKQAPLIEDRVGLADAEVVVAKTESRSVLDYAGEVCRKLSGMGLTQKVEHSKQESIQDWNILIKKLSAQRPLLKGISGELEQTFMLLGSGLEKLVEGSGRLLSRCETLRELQAGEKKDQDVEQVLQLLNAPLQFLAECESDLRELTVKLRNADQQIGGVLSFGTSVRRTLAPLAYMQVLFRSEAARLPLEMQEMFTTLAGEIQQLHHKLQSIFDVRIDAVKETRGTVLQGISKLEEIIADHKQTTTIRRLKVQETLAVLQQELNRSQNRDVGVAEASRNISEKVGQIVVGLQSQDIINQRMSHVMEALNQVIDRYDLVQKNGNPDELGDFAYYVSMVSGLEVGQLEGIIQEAINAEKAIQSGVDCILDSITKITQACLGSQGSQEAAGTSSPTAQLAALVEALIEPLMHTQQRTTIVCDMTASLGSHASDLTGIINEVSGSIWLTGLNAQVQSAQMVHGTGLGILSAQTSFIACETKSVASEVALQVKVLGENFRAIVDKLNDIRDKAAFHQTTLAAGGTQHREHLVQLNREMLANGSEVSAFADNIRATVVEVQQAGRFQTTITGAVNETTQILERLGKLAKAQARKPNSSERSAAMLTEHKTKYTMATEVATFNKAMATRSEVATSEPAPVENPTSELFDDTEPLLVLSNSFSEMESGTAGNDRVATAEKTLSETSDTNPVAPEKNLGNNVELF